MNSPLRPVFTPPGLPAPGTPYPVRNVCYWLVGRGPWEVYSPASERIGTVYGIAGPGPLDLRYATRPDAPPERCYRWPDGAILEILDTRETER